MEDMAEEFYGYKWNLRNASRVPEEVVETSDETPETSDDTKKQDKPEAEDGDTDKGRTPFFMYYIDQMQKQMSSTRSFIRLIALYSEQVHCLLKSLGPKNEVIASMYEDYWPDANDFRTAMEDMTYLWMLHQEDMAKLQPCIEEYVDRLEEIQKLVGVHTEEEVARMKEENIAFPNRKESKPDVSHECKWTQTGGKKPVGDFLLEWHCRIPKTARGLHQLLERKGQPYVSNCRIPLPLNRPVDVSKEPSLLMDSGPCENLIPEKKDLEPIPTDYLPEDSKKDEELSPDDQDPLKPKDSFSRCCSKLNISTGKYRHSDDVILPSKLKPEVVKHKRKDGIKDELEFNPETEKHKRRERSEVTTKDERGGVDLWGGWDEPTHRFKKAHTESQQQRTSRRRKKRTTQHSSSDTSVPEEHPVRSSRPQSIFKASPTAKRTGRSSLVEPLSRHLVNKNLLNHRSRDHRFSHKFCAGGSDESLPDKMPDVPTNLHVKDIIKAKLPVMILSRIQFLRCCVGRHLKDMERLFRELAEVTHRANEILYDLPCHNPCVFVGETICNIPTNEDPIILQLWTYYPEIRAECCQRSRMGKGMGPPMEPYEACRGRIVPPPPPAESCAVQCDEPVVSTCGTCPATNVPLNNNNNGIEQSCGDSTDPPMPLPPMPCVCETEILVPSMHEQSSSKDVQCGNNKRRRTKHHRTNAEIVDAQYSNPTCSIEIGVTEEDWCPPPVRPKVRSTTEVSRPPMPPQVQCYYPYVNP